MPSALFSTFVLPAYATSNDSLMQQLGLLILAPIILILGFGLRKELEIIVSAIMGLVKGVMDVLNYKMGTQDKYINASNSRDVKTPDGRGSAKIGRGTPRSPTTFKNKTSKKLSVDSVPGSSSEDTV